LAIAALLLTGWRKPARAEPRSPRAQQAVGRGLLDDEQPIGIVVDHLDAPLYRRPGLGRRLLAALTSSALAILIGMLLAIFVSFAIALAVIRLTDLLR
jgi:hypothetical protein